ncbi:MAG: phosphoheptose isomerase, partial [Anaerolineae bacterium]|nr:phosphoheptose isomerase [Anaerolineae bacterium]NIQ81069.1 phosphoheptose isomerase [Anaerolineae bacterium]
MSENCAFCVTPHETSALVLGAALGELGKVGRDKVTFLTSPSIRDFPVWLEQLIAESTGKDGKGIVPIVDEPLTSQRAYGADRFFVHLFIDQDENAELEGLLNALGAAGHPLVRINMTEKIDVSQEMFRWEMAVAAGGSVMGIHPFNQPNVEMSKELARQMMDKSRKGALAEEAVETVSVEDPEALVKAVGSW